MATARSRLVCPDVTPYYHCVSRCVRRSFLCGEDALTGRSFEHRRDWIEQRILTLATYYCVDVYAYAVMSNHYHLVVSLNQPQALALSDRDVVERWCVEHKMPLMIKSWLAGELLTDAQKTWCDETITEWRERLCSLSWFMKELNYGIAVQANKEDDCTGRFWEGRFKSQALLDEKALLSAMAYVELNPVRAEMVSTPEEAKHTSLRARLDALEQGKTQVQGLANFVGNLEADNTIGIPFRLLDYLELVDWVGRHARESSAGYIAASTPNILTRLAFSDYQCLTLCTRLEQETNIWVGAAHKFEHAKKTLNKQRITGFQIS